METVSTFSIQSAFKFAWDKFKIHWRIFVIAMAIIVGVQYVPTIFFEQESAMGTVVSIVISIVLIVLEVGLLKIVLKIHDNQAVEVSDLFNYYPLFLKFLVTSLLQGIIVLAGLILLVIPGIIWAVTYCFAPLIVIDTGVGPIEALKRSAKLTKGHKWQLLGLYLVIMILNILGTIPFMLGLILTVPLTLLAMGYVYRQLKDRTENTDLPVIAPPSAVTTPN